MNSLNPRSRPPAVSPAGPAEPRRSATRVAVLSDVPANVSALRAVPDEVAQAGADLVVFTGDLTWGPDPVQTLAIVRGLGDRALFVRGNADRAVLELASDGVPGEPDTPVDRAAWGAMAAVPPSSK